jgi:hypothetical protein
VEEIRGATRIEEILDEKIESTTKPKTDERRSLTASGATPTTVTPEAAAKFACA